MTKPSALTDILNAPSDQPFAPPAADPKPPAKTLPLPSWCSVSPKCAAGEQPVALSTDAVLLRFAASQLPGTAPNIVSGEVTPLPSGCAFKAPAGFAIEVQCLQTAELTDDVDQALAGYRLLPGYVVAAGFRGRGEVPYTLGPSFTGAHKSVTIGMWVRNSQAQIAAGTIIGVARLVAQPLEDCRRL